MSTETNTANQKTVGKHKAGIIPRKQNSFLNNKKTTNKRTHGNQNIFVWRHRIFESEQK